MESIYIGNYSNTNVIPGLECGEGAAIILHRLDEETYILSDDSGGCCLPDRPIPAAIGKRAMAGDFRALNEAGADLQAFFLRPNFRFAEDCASH